MSISPDMIINVATIRPLACIKCITARAIPFSCFSFAALHLPAAHSAVLNATAPLFGAVFSMVWPAERLTMQKLAGLLLGITGVAILVGAGSIALTSTTLFAVAACLVAAAGYALSSIIVKKTGHPDGIHPIAMAAGSMALDSLIMLQTIPFSLPAGADDAITCAVH